MPMHDWTGAEAGQERPFELQFTRHATHRFSAGYNDSLGYTSLG